MHRYTTTKRKLPTLAILGICFAGALLVALVIGLILNATLDEETYYRLTKKPRIKESGEILFVPDVPDVIASPYALDGDLSEATGRSAVAVSLNDESGAYTYQSDVLTYFKTEKAGKNSLADALRVFGSTRTYVSALYYPQSAKETNASRRIAKESEEAAAVREFFALGGGDVILAGLDFATNEEASLATVGTLKRAVGEKAIGVAVPASQTLFESSRQTLERLLEVCDFLALDLRDLNSSHPLDETLAELEFISSQYHMRLLFSTEQTEWIERAQKLLLSNYDILN